MFPAHNFYWNAIVVSFHSQSQLRHTSALSCSVCGAFCNVAANIVQDHYLFREIPSSPKEAWLLLSNNSIIFGECD